MRKIKDKYGAVIADKDAPEAFWESKKFLKLNEKWAKKLKRSGFEDAEEFNSPNEMMKQHHNHHFLERNKHLPIAETVEYYESCKELLNTREFKTRLERRVWELYCEGFGGRYIAKTLRKKEWPVKKIIKDLVKLIKKDAKTILEERDLARKSDD